MRVMALFLPGVEACLFEHGLSWKASDAVEFGRSFLTIHKKGGVTLDGHLDDLPGHHPLMCMHGLYVCTLEQTEIWVSSIL